MLKSNRTGKLVYGTELPWERNRQVLGTLIMERVVCVILESYIHKTVTSGMINYGTS